MFNQNDQQEKKLDWMYKGANSMVDREEYLLGRSIDKTLEQLNAEDKQKQIGAVLPPKNHVEHECIPPSIRDYKLQQQLAEQVDLQAKLQEDPLITIKKREEETRRQFLQNPVQLKKLQKALSKQQKKTKKKKKRDLDERLAEKLRFLKEEDPGVRKKDKRNKDLDIILMHKFNVMKGKLSEDDLRNIMQGNLTESDSENSYSSEDEEVKKIRKKRNKRDESSDERERIHNDNKWKSSLRLDDSTGKSKHKKMQRNTSKKRKDPSESLESESDSDDRKKKYKAKNKGKKQKETSDSSESDSDSDDYSKKHNKPKRDLENLKFDYNKKQRNEIRKRRDSSESSTDSDDYNRKSKLKKAMNLNSQIDKKNRKTKNSDSEFYQSNKKHRNESKKWSETGERYEERNKRGEDRNKRIVTPDDRKFTERTGYENKTNVGRYRRTLTPEKKYSKIKENRNEDQSATADRKCIKRSEAKNRGNENRNEVSEGRSTTPDRKFIKRNEDRSTTPERKYINKSSGDGNKKFEKSTTPDYNNSDESDNHYDKHNSDSESDLSKNKKMNWGLVKSDGTKIPLSKNKVETSTKIVRTPPIVKSFEAPKRKVLSEEEKEKLRREMMRNAEWRDQERVKNIKRYRESDAKDVCKDYNPDFVHKELAKSAANSTVESRIRSNLNNIQRSSRDMNSHFSRRH